MQFEEFKNKREFNNKFPSKIYRCSYCNSLTTNPYICTNCGKQANQLFSNKTYKFKIEKDVEEIFKPIEKEVEENDKFM